MARDNNKTSFFRSRMFIGLMCVIAALALFVGNSIMPQLLNTQTTVVIMTADVPQGSVIREEDVKVERVFTSSVKSLAPLKDKNNAVGRYAVSDLYAGDVVTATKLSSGPTYNDMELYDLPEGKLAISISVESLEQGVADKLIPGDVVSLYAVYEQFSNYLEASEVVLPAELQYVKVISVSDSDGFTVDNAYRTRLTEGGATGNTAAVTLEVNGTQALVIAQIQARGHFHIALAARGTRAASLLKIQDQVLIDMLTQQTADETDAGTVEGGDA